jgi:hypothetical protein
MPTYNYTPSNRQPVKIDLFKRCLNILDYKEGDVEMKNWILTGNQVDIYEDFVDKYRRELGINLYEKATQKEKKSLICFYIDQIQDIISIKESFSNLKQLDITTEWSQYPISYKYQLETDESKAVEVRAHYLFSMLFEVVQNYCIKYDIPFIEICIDQYTFLESIYIKDLYLEKSESPSDSVNNPDEAPANDINTFLPHKSMSVFFELLKSNFSEEDQIKLFSILKDGKSDAKPLLFLGSGKRLSKIFKQFCDSNDINGWRRKELEDWIRYNIKFRYRGEENKFIIESTDEILPTSSIQAPEQKGLKSERKAPEIGRTRQFIIDEIGMIDKNKGWGFAFANELDYHLFLDLLTCYFEYKPYSIPNSIIKLKRGCKTRFAKVLNPIHVEFSETPLKSDLEFFKILRILNHFERMTDFEIYKAINR